jgi:hypothetical protein
MCSLVNYSSLNASIGLMLTALRAGINPAKMPEMTKMPSDVMAMLKFISGFLNISDSAPLDVIR